MKQGEQTQEDARKCGDLLLIAEAMLEIVNEHNRETFPPLDVRIGALCFALLHLLRAYTSSLRPHTLVALFRFVASVWCALLRILRAHLL